MLTIESFLESHPNLAQIGETISITHGTFGAEHRLVRIANVVGGILIESNGVTVWLRGGV